MIMRCAIHTRVSTDNQVEKDYNYLETIDMHRKLTHYRH